MDALFNGIVKPLMYVQMDLYTGNLYKRSFSTILSQTNLNNDTMLYRSCILPLQVFASLVRSFRFK